MSLPREDGKKWLLVGRSGSGKSTLARAMARRYAKRGYPTVIVQGHAHQWLGFGPSMVITQERAEKRVDFQRLLADHKAVRFVAAGYDMDAWFDGLAGAILERGSMLVVLDDQQGYLGANAPRNVARLYMEGRFRRVHVITITQRLGNTSGTGTTMHARANVDHAVLFQVGDNTDYGRLKWLVPEAASVCPTLASPGGYIWRDTGSGRTVVHSPRGRREVSR